MSHKKESSVVKTPLSSTRTSPEGITIGARKLPNKSSSKSAKLLKLWAYFDRQDLWFDLLRHANSADESIQKLTKDKLNFNEAIILLCNFGLVDLDLSPQQQVGPRGYSVHSCVHS